MCGIAGIINYQGIDPDKIATALRHRGPDDQKIYINNNVALIHTRLSIQDIQHGIQPFHYGTYSIVFNGEIYNHKSLRSHLTDFSFSTNSDTETLLYLFIKFKFRMFELIDGMFAFCIYDKATGELILGRDRAGKKPIYIYRSSNRLIFSSEINAIKSVVPLTLNENAISTYLRCGYIYGDKSPYLEISELPPASYMVVNTSNLSSQQGRFFNILDYYTAKQEKGLTFKDHIEITDKLLTRSVHDRLSASDVEVGVFLSGGIDSNLIAAIAARLKPGIKTFTVKFEDGYDESKLAGLAANYYKTDHINLSVNSRLSEDIEKIICAYGEPFMDSSAIPCYYVSREASKFVKVVLSGDGADELFAGYRRYVPIKYNILTISRLLKYLEKILPAVNKKQSGINYIKRLISISGKSNLDFYLSATTDVFEDVIKIKDDTITNDLASFTESVFTHEEMSPLKKMLYLDYSIILFSDLLVKMDIASMQHSLEVRSPFLSKYLLEYAPTIPDHYKISRFKTKFILRELAKKYLPTELVNQPKRGFEVPLVSWVDSKLRNNIHDQLSSGCYAEKYVGRKFIKQLLSYELSMTPDKRAKMIWSLFCLETWYKYE